MSPLRIPSIVKAAWRHEVPHSCDALKHTQAQPASITNVEQQLNQVAACSTGRSSQTHFPRCFTLCCLLVLLLLQVVVVSANEQPVITAHSREHQASEPFMRPLAAQGAVASGSARLSLIRRMSPSLPLPFALPAQAAARAQAEQAGAHTIKANANRQFKAAVDADGTFAAQVGYATGLAPNSVYSVDVNGDSKADILVSNGDANSVSVLINYGGGTFKAKEDYTTGLAPYSVYAVDVDGDSKADILTANGDANSVSVLINNGDGTFKAKVDYSSGATPYSVYAVDVDGDSKADILTANNNEDSVSVLINNGDGTFKAKVDYSTGSIPVAVYSVDVDGDSKADILTANGGADSVSVLINNGDGTFKAAVDYSSGSYPYSLYSVDVDGDSKADILVANYDANSVSVLINNGDGTFKAKVDYATGTSPSTVYSLDVDGDSKADILTANYNENSVSVLINNGDGTFKAKVDYATGANPVSVYSVDVNGDSKSDILTANYAADSVAVLLNNPTPDTTAPVLSAVPSDLVASATSSSGAVVSYTPPTATDDVDGSCIVMCIPASGSTFPLGNTTVTCFAHDAANNVASASFTVYVVDVTAPVIASVASYTATINTDAGQTTATYTYSAPLATDNVDGTFSATCSPASPATLPVGDNTFVCSAQDTAGNSATSVSFTITVNQFEWPCTVPLYPGLYYGNCPWPFYSRLASGSSCTYGVLKNLAFKPNTNGYGNTPTITCNAGALTPNITPFIYRAQCVLPSNYVTGVDTKATSISKDPASCGKLKDRVLAFGSSCKVVLSRGYTSADPTYKCNINSLSMHTGAGLTTPVIMRK